MAVLLSGWSIMTVCHQQFQTTSFINRSSFFNNTYADIVTHPKRK